jgi:hypothetical protein
MSRHDLSRRPEVEPLESMQLLSGIAAAVPLPAALVATSRSPIVLTGATSGTYHLQGETSHFTGTGTVSPLGHCSLKGSITRDAATDTAAGSLTITTPKGKVHVAVTYIGLVGASFDEEYSYDIEGGTNHWAGATGRGDAIITAFPSASVTHGRFTIEWGVIIG